MTLAATVLLAPHFTAGEMGVAGPGVPVDVVANARTTAQWLEVARAVLGGNPVTVTSGYRPPRVNAEAGGSLTSDHLEGLAADWTVHDMTAFQVYRRLVAAQESRLLAPFDQLIFYALDGHIHVGLGPKMRGEILLKTAEGSYVALAGSYVQKLAGYL